VIDTPLHRRSAFKAWWKASTAMIAAALMQQVSWKAAAISIGVGFLTSSWEIIWDEPDSGRPEDPKP
jgi:hypothetical protein